MADDELGVMRDSLGVELGEGDRVYLVGSNDVVMYVRGKREAGAVDLGLSPAAAAGEPVAMLSEDALVRMEACEDAHEASLRWGRAQ